MQFATHALFNTCNLQHLIILIPEISFNFERFRKYRDPWQPFWISRLPTYSHRRKALIKKPIYRKLLRTPKNLGVRTFPNPVGHFMATGHFRYQAQPTSKNLSTESWPERPKTQGQAPFQTPSGSVPPICMLFGETVLSNVVLLTDLFRQTHFPLFGSIHIYYNSPNDCVLFPVSSSLI